MISTVNSNVNRISGLASGLDTETLVKQMTAVTSSKIEAAEQQKTKLEWTQDAYRDILNKLYDFNQKYFGTTPGSITSGTALTTLRSESSSDYVTAVAGPDAQAGNVFIGDIVSLATGAKLTGDSSVSEDPSIMVNQANLSSLTDKSLHVTLDGETKTITFTGTYGAAADVGSDLQSLLDAAFGTGRIGVTESGGTITLDSPQSRLTLGAAEDDLTGILDFEDGASNRISTSSTLSSLLGISDEEHISFSVNGVSFDFSGASKLSGVMTAVNTSSAGARLSYSEITDTFTLSATKTGAGSSISFTDSEGSLLDRILGEGVYTAGTDAVLTLSLDGSQEDMLTVNRSTNTFEIDGVTLTLNGMAAGIQQEAVTVKTGMDAEAVYDKIMDFVDGYNDLLSSITDKLYEKKYNGYQPLTDEQKENLSDDEQEKWTEYAKSGLLRNDLAISSIANSLRSCLTKSIANLGGVGSIGVILSDIGITTGSYTDYGKLTVDGSKLKSAISSDPDKVLSLFTQESSVGYSMYNTDENKTLRFSESGLMWRINDIVKSNLSAVGKKGTLITLVGSPGNDFSGITVYSKKLSDADENISSLEKKLSEQQDRYWSKFTYMETALSKLNATNSWLTTQLTANSSNS